MRMILKAGLGLVLASTAIGTALAQESGRLQAGDFTYLGAFRLPDTGKPRPQMFDYGGNGMAFNPKGDPSGGGDGFPGSLIMTGHERIVGDVPNGDQLAEVAIPAPVKSKDLAALKTAKLLNGFVDTLARRFVQRQEIPTVGLAYLDRPETGPKIHVTFGQHVEEDPKPTHAWFDPDLSPGSVRGAWFIDDASFYSVTKYVFEIPQDWADKHVGGMPLATGRFREGGWSGMGPSLFAYRPWMDKQGTPAADGTHLKAVTLLLYPNSRETESTAVSMKNFQMPDDWGGGAWITTKSGKSAVLFAGTKGIGKKYWYGFVNPAGPDKPCVFQEVVGQYPACRNAADGSLCPQSELTECPDHDYVRGWWAGVYQAQFIFYDPNDFAKVAAGKMKPSAPQPYAAVPIDAALRLATDPSVVDWVGSGVQRRQRIGAVAYDRANQLLYVQELFGDDAKPLIHVWRVQ
ncbi:hypothetical protein [Dongia sp. agr-C8]